MDVSKKNSVEKAPIKDRFPRIVIIIVIAEFCERFSYSGMRAFLTLYLKSKLGYTDDGATEIYHIFSTLVYLFPIFGGILADNYLGKFRTILYMMFVYAAGNLLVAITAIPQLSLPGRLCTLIGLLMITIGTGGIKPCVTAFGGDQFVLPQQEKHLAIYFSVLYFTLCTGSLIAKAVSPILRSEVTCFGDKDCYSLAFGAPGFVIIAAMIIFVSARNKYVMKAPEGNIVFDFVKCVSYKTYLVRFKHRWSVDPKNIHRGRPDPFNTGFLQKLGVKNAILKRRKANTHWLDTTKHRYDEKFIRDVKKTLSILTLFTVLPVFWSLLDQLGSRWTLQATKMDGRFGYITIKPDQMQVLVPTFILITIPIAQKYVYPFMESRGMLRNPLHKLILGGILAGVAFIVSGTVEIYLKTTYPQLPGVSSSQLRIFNGNPCSIAIHNENITYTIPSLHHYTLRNIDVPNGGVKNITFELGGSCIEPRSESFVIDDNTAVSFFYTNDTIHRYLDKVDKSRSGFPIVRFLVSNSLYNANITLYNEKRQEIETDIYPGVSQRHEVFIANYTIRCDGDVIRSLELDSGGVYAVVLDNIGKDYRSNLIVVSAGNSISMAWLLPQFFIMSVAEVLFAVTGNEFAFKESPESMKAVMSATWLLTEAFGNVLIIAVTRIFINQPQEIQFFIFTGMMFTSIAVFYWLSRGYKCTGLVATDNCYTKDTRSNSVALYHQVKQIEDCIDP